MAKEIKLHEIKQISHITACIFYTPAAVYTSPVTVCRTLQYKQIGPHNYTVALPDQKTLCFAIGITSFSLHHYTTFITASNLH